MPSAEEHWTDMHFVARIVSTHDPVVCVKNNKLPIPKVCEEIMKADAVKYWPKNRLSYL